MNMRQVPCILGPCTLWPHGAYRNCESEQLQGGRSRGRPWKSTCCELFLNLRFSKQLNGYIAIGNAWRLLVLKVWRNFILGRLVRRNIFCEGALWFEKQVLRRWHHQDSWVSSWQYFRGFFYAPGSNDWGHIVFVLSVCLFVCLSVCLFVVNFNLRYNFWTVIGIDFIFGMHTLLMMPFQMTPRSMTLWPWLWPLC